MSFNFPYTILFLLPIIGFLIIDLKFDFHVDKEITLKYYNAQFSSDFPGNIFLEIIIGLYGILFTLHFARQRSAFNFICLILGIATLEIFIFRLIPLGESLLF